MILSELNIFSILCVPSKCDTITSIVPLCFVVYDALMLLCLVKHVNWCVFHESNYRYCKRGSKSHYASGHPHSRRGMFCPTRVQICHFSVHLIANGTLTSQLSFSFSCLNMSTCFTCQIQQEEATYTKKTKKQQLPSEKDSIRV